jgi:hypothetical protein
MDEDRVPEETALPQGPITDAYLNRDVHPDDIPGTKASHYGPTEVGGSLFAVNSEAPHPCEDTWLFH